MLGAIFGLPADDWQAIGAIAGVPLVVGSLLTVAFQVMREAKAERAAVYQEIVRTMLDIDGIFVERPELRKYFYRGVAIEPGDPEYERTLALAEMIVDFADNVVQQAERMGEDLTKYWQAYLCDLYESSPPVREFWAENCHWYAPDLHAVLGTPENTAAHAPGG